MYRVVQGQQLGPIANYALCEKPRRPLAAGEVRVSVRAAGISYVDVLTAAGEYQVQPPVPFIPGSEAAGVVIEAAADVMDFAPEDHVVCGGWHGLFAEECVLPSRELTHIPATLDLVEAAVVPASFSTAWHALVDRARVQPMETVLVLGAGGATGQAAVQVAKFLGARVIASASTEAKRTLALASGAHAAVDARSEQWRDEVKLANDGNPVDVIFDPVGGTATELAFRNLRWNGRHLVVGFPGGIPSVRTNLVLLKSASLIGVNIRDFYANEPDKAARNMTRVLELAGKGQLRPAIAATYPIENYAAAMAEAARGESAGRIVLKMEPR